MTTHQRRHSWAAVDGPEMDWKPAVSEPAGESHLFWKPAASEPVGPSGGSKLYSPRAVGERRPKASALGGMSQRLGAIKNQMKVVSEQFGACIDEASEKQMSVYSEQGKTSEKAASSSSDGRCRSMAA